ncbi:MAG: LacI family transcriptional regulator [Gaiellales bacterium]|nr:LacI family transcriptional regulator [Gaiellales bacterium]
MHFVEPGFGPLDPSQRGRVHVKLEDVAVAAGVSLSTASRALRGHSAVNDRTRRRVQSAAERLGYEPNRMASALRARTSPFIGIVVPDLTIPFFALVVKAAQDVLENAGFQVLVMNTDRHAQQEREALRTLLAHRANGVLLATSGGYEDSHQLPLVFFANFEAAAPVARVALSNREGVALLVEHVLEHGHTRVAYVGGQSNVTSGSERLAAFGETMRAAGMGDSMRVRLSDSWSPASAEAAVIDLLDDAEPPTAIVAGGDTFALGAIKAIRGRGLRIPEDVALVSFQNPDRVGGVIEPPLTTLAAQERELGQHAASLLLHLLSVSDHHAGATEVRLPATLIVRRSCGCGLPADGTGTANVLAALP